MFLDMCFFMRNMKCLQHGDFEGKNMFLDMFFFMRNMKYLQHGDFEGKKSKMQLIKYIIWNNFNKK